MVINVVSPYKKAKSTVWTGDKRLTKELTLCELIEGLSICLSLSTTVFIMNLLKQNFFRKENFGKEFENNQLLQ